MSQLAEPLVLQLRQKRTLGLARRNQDLRAHQSHDPRIPETGGDGVFDVGVV